VGNILETMKFGAEWHIFAEDMRYAKPTTLWHKGKEHIIMRGPVVYEVKSSNLLMNFGRDNALRQQFNITDGPSQTFWDYGGVGDDATSPTTTTFTALQNELTAGTNRKALTDVAGGSINNADISGEITGNFTRKIVVQYEYAQVDVDLDGETFAEYALFDAQPVVTGNMFNRFVPATSFVKSSSFKVTVQVTLRA